MWCQILHSSPVNTFCEGWTRVTCLWSPLACEASPHSHAHTYTLSRTHPGLLNRSGRFTSPDLHINYVCAQKYFKFTLLVRTYTVGDFYLRNYQGSENQVIWSETTVKVRRIEVTVSSKSFANLLYTNLMWIKMFVFCVWFTALTERKCQLVVARTADKIVVSLLGVSEESPWWYRNEAMACGRGGVRVWV